MLKLEKEKCSGCGACANICPTKAITMQADSEGFPYPVIAADRCVGCHQCERVCPQLHSGSLPPEKEPQIWSAQAKSPDIRQQSSSGGIFMVLAQQVIREGGVVFGAAFTDSFELQHIQIEKAEELYRLAGSKYLQSSIGSAYASVRQFLKAGRTVLFSGTPCQVAGLKAFLAHEYETLICVDFICHGVPSPQYWKKYIDYRSECAGARPVQISFRDKSQGWHSFSVRFLFENGQEYCVPHSQDPYMKLFLNDLNLRPSCYQCGFKTIHRVSDLTIADFWGVRHVCPEMDDDTGVSLVVIQSERGGQMLDRIRSQLLLKDVPLGAVMRGNGSIVRSAARPPKRQAFFETINQLNPSEAADKFAKPSKKQASITFLKKIVKEIIFDRG